MKTMIALSTLGAALATVGSVLMLNSHNVKAADGDILDQSTLLLNVEASEELELISVPDYDFNTVTQNQIKVGFKLPGVEPTGQEMLSVSDARDRSSYTGWSLTASKVAFTDGTITLNSGGSLSLDNATKPESLTINTNPIIDGAQAVEIAQNVDEAADQYFIADKPLATLTHEAYTAQDVAAGSNFTGTLEWTLSPSAIGGRL